MKRQRRLWNSTPQVETYSIREELEERFAPENTPRARVLSTHMWVLTWDSRLPEGRLPPDSQVILHRLFFRCMFLFFPYLFCWKSILCQRFRVSNKSQHKCSKSKQANGPRQLGDLNVPFHIRAGPGRGSKSRSPKGAHVYMKSCICWPVSVCVYACLHVCICVCVCALSQGLGDYVDKRCTWCFRLSFSPPLPPFILPPSPLSPSPPAISNISLRLLKD